MCFVLLSTEASCLLLSFVLICTYLPSNESDACPRWVRITRALRRYQFPVLLASQSCCGCSFHAAHYSMYECRFFTPRYHTLVPRTARDELASSRRLTVAAHRILHQPQSRLCLFRASCAAFVSKGGELRQHGRRGWCRRGPWHSVRRVTVM